MASPCFLLPLFACTHVCTHTFPASFCFLAEMSEIWSHILPFPHCVSVWAEEWREEPSSLICNHSLRYQNLQGRQAVLKSGHGVVSVTSCWASRLAAPSPGTFWPIWTPAKKDGGPQLLSPGKDLPLSDFCPVQWLGISVKSSPQPCCISSSYSKEARQDLICGTRQREMSFQAQEINLMSSFLRGGSLGEWPTLTIAVSWEQPNWLWAVHQELVFLEKNPLTFLYLKTKCNDLIFEEIQKPPFICLLLACPGSTSPGLWSLL